MHFGLSVSIPILNRLKVEFSLIVCIELYVPEFFVEFGRNIIPTWSLRSTSSISEMESSLYKLSDSNNIEFTTGKRGNDNVIHDGQHNTLNRKRHGTEGEEKTYWICTVSVCKARFVLRDQRVKNNLHTTMETSKQNSHEQYESCH